MRKRLAVYICFSLAPCLFAQTSLSAESGPVEPPADIATTEAVPADKAFPTPVGDPNRLPLSASDPATCLGANLTEIFRDLGAPLSTAVARGPEAWQDDVVFMYPGFEIYIHEDRVWQVKADALFGLRVGDIADTALERLGVPLERRESAYLFQILGTAYPRRLSVGIGLNGLIQYLYFYRADF